MEEYLQSDLIDLNTNLKKVIEALAHSHRASDAGP